MSGHRDEALNEADQKDEKKDLERLSVGVPAEMMDWVRARQEEYRWPKLSHAFVWAMAEAMKREGYVFRKRRKHGQDCTCMQGREAAGAQGGLSNRPPEKL